MWNWNQYGECVRTEWIWGYMNLWFENQELQFSDAISRIEKLFPILYNRAFKYVRMFALLMYKMLQRYIISQNKSLYLEIFSNTYIWNLVISICLENNLKQLFSILEDLDTQSFFLYRSWKLQSWRYCVVK